MTVWASIKAVIYKMPNGNWAVSIPVKIQYDNFSETIVNVGMAQAFSTEFSDCTLAVKSWISKLCDRTITYQDHIMIIECEV